MFWQHWSIFILVEAKVLKTQPFTKNVGGAMKKHNNFRKNGGGNSLSPPPLSYAPGRGSNAYLSSYGSCLTLHIRHRP